MVVSSPNGSHTAFLGFQYFLSKPNAARSAILAQAVINADGMLSLRKEPLNITTAAHPWS